MSRLFGARAGLGLLLVLFAWMAWAQVAVPELTRRVTDLTGTLTAVQANALESRLAAFEAQKGSQIAVLIVPTTQPEDIAQFGIRVADAWKIGREKVDDGVILIVARNDRTLRIEVGYGLEGPIPDAVAKRVIAETIVPYFKTGDYAGGIDAGVAQLMKLIEGEALPMPGTGEAHEEYLVLLIAGGVVAGFALSLAMGRSAAAGVAALGSGALGALLVGLTPLLLFVAVFVFVAVAGGFRGGGGGWSSGGGGFGGGSWGGGGGGFGGGGASGSW